MSGTPTPFVTTIPATAQIPKPKPERVSLMIFGASGDLTARKLIPALYHLFYEGYLKSDSVILGVARRGKSDEQFRREMEEAVRKSEGENFSPETWTEFSNLLRYHCLDITNPEEYSDLQARLKDLEPADCAPRRVVYLATSPFLFEPAVAALGQAGMIPSPEQAEQLKVVVEKPFGQDLETARELSRNLKQLLTEDQIYRIDHYLGKETVQNILLFRFGNAIIEPLLSRSHVDHVQITVAEDQGMERGRGGYYDKSGALRDVLQNHVLQLLCLVAMDPPAYFRAKEIRDEKLKVLQALSPGHRSKIDEWAIPGQYTAGSIDGEEVVGYREEDRVDENSLRETYVAMDVRVDNWRWAGVPFYLRTGKRMSERVSEIAIQFKHPPLNLFTTVECEGDICDLVEAKPNQLVFRIQPKEAISLQLSTKRPGMQYQIHPVEMDFEYAEEFHTRLPEAYQRLLLDVIRGDSTLFMRDDELEAAWEFVDPVLKHWNQDGVKPEEYAAGSWGPAKAERMLAGNNHQWRTPVEYVPVGAIQCRVREGTTIMWHQQQISLSPRSRGFHLITGEVLRGIPELQGIRAGILHVFLKHTSASISINENADPDVPLDLETAINAIVPEDFPYRHTLEGSDDMPAHVKASLFGNSLSIPISDGRLCLGTWQGFTSANIVTGEAVGIWY